MRKFFIITITLSITTATIVSVASVKWPDEPSLKQGPWDSIYTLNSLVPTTDSILKCILSFSLGPLRAEAQPVQKEVTRVEASWDLVVLGSVDACWVCQFGPVPHIRYTQVLAGEVPSGQTTGRLALVAVAERLLPESRVPIYKSQKEEICFLKRIAVPSYEAGDVYEVVDVMEATPKNLAAFRRQ